MSRSSILQPGELEKARGAIAEWHEPAVDLFVRREKRCRQLARQGNMLAAYLHFVARLCALQHEELLDPVAGARCDEATGQRSFVASPALPQLWAQVRRLGAALADTLPPAQRHLFGALPERAEPWFTEQVDALLAGHLPAAAGVVVATAPLTAAALQVAWTRQVRLCAQTLPPRHEESAVCPLCGGQPVAGVIVAAGPSKGLRYLHCGLCGSDWHVVRSKCSHCGGSQGLSYCTVQGLLEHVRAELCLTCRSYIKVMYQEQEPELEPLADDLATLALDLRMAEDGYLRSGTNPLFFPGPVSSPV